MATRKVPEGMKRVQATITMLVSETFEDYDTNKKRRTTHTSLTREIRDTLPCITPFGSIESVTAVSIVELDEPNYAKAKKGAK